MKNDFTFLSSDGKTLIYATSWTPEGDIKAILQISHGMVEYIGRYARFAEYLSANGILVVGNDHLGHGRSVTSDEDHGYFKHPGGLDIVTRDMHTLRELVTEQYPGVPYFLMGHSMGSFLARFYLMHYAEGLKGAIIMGTGSQPTATLKAGKLICRLIALFKGWRHRSKLVDSMAFSSNNKAFEPARTPCDWLTKDESIVDKYIHDPWCTYKFTLDGFYHLFSVIEAIQKSANIEKTPKDLPLLLASGSDDPVGQSGKGVKKAYEGYLAAGLTNVEMKLYQGDRHEILNELDYKTVFEDLKNWLENLL